jgi:hypothetical protein
MGRPINGIPMGGLDYVLNDDGNERSFSDEAAALEFMHGQGYTDEDIENNGIVFSDVPCEDEDKFYLDSENGIVRWLYYNPDSNAGGQYIENVFDFALIREAADAEDFFDHVGEHCNQYLIDVGMNDFAGYDELFKTVPCDFEGYTEETKTALIATVSAAYAEGRVLITKDNIEIDSEIFFEDDHINAYIAAWFDVDERFGTATHDTDDYLNVYANYYPKTEGLEVGYTLIKADGSDSDFVAVELVNSEHDAIFEKLQDAGLDECIAEMRDEQNEDEGMTMA